MKKYRLFNMCTYLVPCYTRINKLTTYLCFLHDRYNALNLLCVIKFTVTDIEILFFSPTFDYQLTR